MHEQGARGKREVVNASIANRCMIYNNYSLITIDRLRERRLSRPFTLITTMSTLLPRSLLSRSLSCPHRGSAGCTTFLRRRLTTPASEPNNNNSSSSKPLSMWQKFLAPKEIPPRGTFGWYREMALICTVFGITGSSTMMVRKDKIYSAFVHSLIRPI